MICTGFLLDCVCWKSVVTLRTVQSFVLARKFSRASSSLVAYSEDVLIDSVGLQHHTVSSLSKLVRTLNERATPLVTKLCILTALVPPSKDNSM